MPIPRTAAVKNIVLTTALTAFRLVAILRLVLATFFEILVTVFFVIWTHPMPDEKGKIR